MVLEFKAKYGQVSGLQSVVLADKYALLPQPGEFLQILNVNGNLISTIGCPPATVNVYDSLHGTLPSQTQQVVADSIRYMDTQWQSNGYDCGIFATALCAGMEPTSVTFDQ